jgi:hypothetical protein
MSTKGTLVTGDAEMESLENTTDVFVQAVLTSNSGQKGRYFLKGR